MDLSGEQGVGLVSVYKGLRSLGVLLLSSRSVHMELQTTLLVHVHTSYTKQLGEGAHSNISVVMIISVTKANINIYWCTGH